LSGLSYVLDASGADKDLALVEAYDLEGEVEVWGSLGSRSSVAFDLDDDYDLDIVTNEFNAAPMVLVSNLSERKLVRALKIRLIGTTSNRSGVGARVSVHAGGAVYTKRNDGKSGYLSMSVHPLYFGLGERESASRIEVSWPSGKTQSLEGPFAANQTLEIREP
jgi:hypothetical protein